MSRRGFTLVELLLVIVVIALLAGLAFGLMSVIDGSRVRVTEGRVDTLGFEVGGQITTKGFPPATLEELAKRLDKPEWMKNGKFVDIWGQPIEYTVTGKKFRLWSCGPDGVSGTADDISYKRN